jgi:ribosomal protein S1
LQKVTAVVKKAPTNDRIILGVTSGFRQKKSLSELAANAINTIDDVEVGSLVKVQVKRIYDNQMTVTVGMHVQGRVHISEVTDDITDSNPLSKFSVGQVIDEARVVSVSNSSILFLFLRIITIV